MVRKIYHSIAPSVSALYEHGVTPQLVFDDLVCWTRPISHCCSGCEDAPLRKYSHCLEASCQWSNLLPQARALRKPIHSNVCYWGRGARGIQPEKCRAPSHQGIQIWLTVIADAVLSIESFATWKILVMKIMMRLAIQSSRHSSLHHHIQGSQRAVMTG